MYRPLLTFLLCLAVREACAAGCAIPLQPTRTAFVTAVWIGSHGPLRFLVDTGATTTVVERSVADQVGLRPSRVIAAITTTGTVDVQEATVEELRAGEVTVARMPVLIAALPRFASHGHLHGILGMNFFAGRALLIDLRRRCLDVDVAAPRGTILEAHEVAGRVAVEVEGLSFIVDSGASFPVLTSARARALAVEDGAFDLTSASGRQRARTATLSVLRIGGTTFRDLAVALASGTDPREDGLLPITLFRSVYIAADRKVVVVR